MATTRHCPVSPLPVSWLLVYEVRQEMTSFYILGRIRDLVGYSAQLLNAVSPACGVGMRKLRLSWLL